MFHRYLTGRPYPPDTHEKQLSPSYPDSLHSSHGHMHHFAGCLLASYPRKHFNLHTHTHTLSLSLSLSLLHTTLTNKSHKKYRVQKIEYNYNQIWHEIKANKTHSCKLQLYNNFWHNFVPQLVTWRVVIDKGVSSHGPLTYLYQSQLAM